MLRRLGYLVTVRFAPAQTLKSLWGLVGALKRTDSIIIRIDGSGTLDRYACIKLFFPGIHIYWEIHGSLEELRWGTSGNNIRIVLKHGLRWLFSWLTSGYLFVSPTLETYMVKSIAQKKSAVLPNVFVPPRGQVKRRDILISIKKRYPSLVVFWGGDPRYRWQGIDLVARVATTMVSIDPRILFVVTGQGSWYRLKAQPNVMVLPLVDESTYWAIADRSHVCLALYHVHPGIPSYFSPLKIITYLTLGKPVIATRTGEISRLISDGANGFLTSNSTTQIVKYIQLLKGQTDLYKRISQTAKQSAQRFTMGSMSVVWKSRLRTLFA